jgi:hypothetical protein
MTGRQVFTGMLLLGLALGLLAGCGGKVSKSNYEKVQTGMTRAEVEGILGKPGQQAGVGGGLGDVAGSATTLTWTEGDKAIIVTFVNDKVTTKVQKGL